MALKYTERSSTRKEILHHDTNTAHRLFGGGVSRDSSPAFLFVPKPMTTLVRSVGTGVPPFDDSASTTVDEILENPGRGAGDPLLAEAAPDIAAGDALPFTMGAGTVMKPGPSS